jgi:hypothetical protein
MSEKSIIETRGDKLVRVPDKTAGQSSRKYLVIYAGLMLLISLAVLHFYFGFGAIGSISSALAAIVLMPMLIVLGIVGLGLIVFVVAFVPFHIVKLRRNKRTREVLASLHCGDRSRPVVLFLRQFYPNRESRLEFHLISDEQEHGLNLLKDEFTSFNLNHWADELSSADLSVLKVAEKIDVEGGSIRIENDTWKREVGKLIGEVDRIIILPGLGEGVWWEAEQIKTQTRVDVTAFVMPYGSTPDEGEEGIWQSCREKFSGLGFEFPEYDRDGMLMRFDCQGQLVSRIPILGTPIEELRTFILGAGDSQPALVRHH